MTDYRQFDSLDFIQDEAFQRWAEGRATPAEQHFWLQFVAENPDKQTAIDQAILTTRALTVTEPTLSEEAIRSQTRRIVATAQETSIVRPFYSQRRVWWAAAAAVLLTATFSLWRWQARQNDPQRLVSNRLYEKAVAESPVTLREQHNSGRKPVSVFLPDGSTVALDSGGRLSYPTRFAPDNRTVYLSGNAVFDVTPDAHKPFLVFANETVTKVLGTSFRISALPDAKRVTVQVRRGLVAVIPKAHFTRTELGTLKTANGVLVRPNQQVVYEREAETIRRSIVDKPALIVPANATTHMVFEDAPVADVLAALEKAYGIDIVYDEASVANCTIRASLYDEPLFDKVQLICKTTGLSYQIIDTQIVITGRGCGY